MTAMTLEEVQAKLPEVLDGLRPGEEVVITRGGEPVARLTPTHSVPAAWADGAPLTRNGVRVRGVRLPAVVVIDGKPVAPPIPPDVQAEYDAMMRSVAVGEVVVMNVEKELVVWPLAEVPDGVPAAGRGKGKITENESIADDAHLADFAEYMS